MSVLTLDDWSSIAQILIAIFTVFGVLVSLYLSTKALREVQFDRKQRQKPHLAFERGGYRYPVTFVKAGKRIPGIDPKVVERLFSGLPDDAESVRLYERKNDDGTINPIRIGRLKNYGLGPALSTHITWVPAEVWIGNEQFKLDEKKLSEPVYSISLNTMPSIPGHIQQNEEAGMSRLPTFIEKDADKKITRVEGILIITTKDVFEKILEYRQEFTIFTNYRDETPSIHVTFGDLVLGN
jgi:hypothetical protein